jgi:toxin secretion/phage lysis holin
MNGIKAVIASVVGITAVRLEIITPLIGFVVFALVMDTITGLLAGRLTPGGLKSRLAALGLAKKTGYLCLLLLGFFLDVAIPYFAYAGLNYTIAFATPFGVIMAAWIVITEAISIIENLSNIGVAVPKWMLKFLKKAHKDIDDKGGTDTENK